MRSAVSPLLLVEWALCLFPISVSATTLHVPSVYPTIQAGVEAASSGDTVLIACGTYFEHDIIMRSSICLRSETGDPDCVTVDAQGEGRVLHCERVYFMTRIEGITFTGGRATGSFPDYYGGGIYCRTSSPKITDCVFSNNTADHHGGGLYCFSSSPTLTNCTFSGNSANDGGGGAAAMGGSSPALLECTFVDNSSLGRGGAMYCNNSSPTLTSCDFSANAADEGGGLFCALSSPSITGCTFAENTADMGGGVACGGNSSPAFSSCVFSENTADTRGGGLSCSYATPTLSECLLVNNSARCGGGLDLWHASPTVTGCTLVANLANGCPGGGISCKNGSSPTLRFCIVAFSMEGEGIFVDSMNSVPSISCCDIYGNAGGDWIGNLTGQLATNGNLSLDPLFCDAANGDFALCEDSPCLDGDGPGDEDCDERIGAYGQGCAACDTPVMETTWGRLKAGFAE